MRSLNEIRVSRNNAVVEKPKEYPTVSPSPSPPRSSQGQKQKESEAFYPRIPSLKNGELNENQSPTTSLIEKGKGKEKQVEDQPLPVHPNPNPIPNSTSTVATTDPIPISKSRSLNTLLKAKEIEDESPAPRAMKQNGKIQKQLQKKVKKTNNTDNNSQLQMESEVGEFREPLFKTDRAKLLHGWHGRRDLKTFHQSQSSSRIKGDEEVNAIQVHNAFLSLIQASNQSVKRREIEEEEEGEREKERENEMLGVENVSDQMRSVERRGLKRKTEDEVSTNIFMKTLKILLGLEGCHSFGREALLESQFSKS